MAAPVPLLPLPIPLFEPLRPLLLLPLALLLEAALGDWRPVEAVTRLPRRLAGRFAAALERKLNRPGRDGAALAVRGALTGMVLAAAALGAGGLAAWAAGAPRGGWLVEILLLQGAFGLRRPWRGALAAATALEAGRTREARAAVAGLARRPLDDLDAHGLARIAVEALVEALNRRFAVPLFWYLLLGLPGLMLGIAADALDGAIGPCGLRYDRFGRAAARFDALADAVPARLAGLALAA